MWWNSNRNSAIHNNIIFYRRKEMKIVIDIPDNVKQRLDEGHIQNGSIMAKVLMDIITNGTPLPKGHGRLIDADAYQTTLEEKARRLKTIDTINGLCGAVALLFDAETIIEADKESEQR